MREFYNFDLNVIYSFYLVFFVLKEVEGKFEMSNKYYLCNYRRVYCLIGIFKKREFLEVYFVFYNFVCV